MERNHVIAHSNPPSLSPIKASGSPVDMAAAREQHAVLVSALRGLGVDVLELAPDEGSAESVYTQDLAVVVNGIALMCRPGPHRQAEVQLVVRNGIISPGT